MSKNDSAVIEPSGKNFQSVIDADSKIVIGDENSVSFKPTATFQKWETGFSLSTPTSKSITPLLDKGILGWDDMANNLGVRFYPVQADNHLLELGGLEYEVILYSAPASADIPFTIETSGLDFFFQPEELTDSELKIGANERAENVKGSFAVYHNSKSGGSKYKSGKAFQLFRPTATDANNAQVYGKWNLDLGGSTLTASFDPSWLKSAAYPVIIGPTLGYTSIGSNSADVFTFIIGSHFQMASSGTATAFNIYTDQGDIDFTMGIYNSDGVTPTSLLSQTAGGPLLGPNSPEWKSKAIAGALLSGHWYCLGITYRFPSNIYYDTNSVPRSYASNSYLDGGMPDPFPTPTNDTTAHSAYVDYTTGGSSIFPRFVGDPSRLAGNGGMAG